MGDEEGDGGGGKGGVSLTGSFDAFKLTFLPERRTSRE